MTVTVLHLVASTKRRGAEVFAGDLARALDARHVPGEVVALTGGGQLPYEIIGEGRFHPRTIRTLRVRAAEASVVVGHGSSALLASYLATVGTPVPFIYRNIGDPDHWVDRPARSWRVGLLLRRAAAVVALWPAAADRLVERHHLDPSRVFVAANGVPVERFTVATDGLRRTAQKRLGLPLDGPVICWIGSLSPEKDPVTALQASTAVRSAHLVIVGDGPMRSELEQLAGRLMPGRVTFASELPDVRPVLTASDVLVLTSLTEGLPAVLIEAGLSGIPVVATRVGGVPEIVDDGKTGVLVPVEDPAAVTSAVEHALGSPEMGDRARAFCTAHYSLDPVADRWHTILRSVVESSAPAD